MDKEYEVKLRCDTCGCDDHFEFNEDKSYVKCTFCNREYFGGIDELLELNHDAVEDVKEEIGKELQKQLKQQLTKAFKGNKYIKIK